ncbi:MAG: hypothetical protein AAFZ74_07180 [Pseudomonadota bacterium]
MTEMTMTPQRVLELIDAFGAEPGAWPEDERAAAAALIAAEPETFQAALDEARAVDALLMEEALPEPSPMLAEAILAAAPRAKPVKSTPWQSLRRLIFPQGVRWPAGAALASLMMGLVGGYAYASTGTSYDAADSAYYTAFGFDSGDAWLELE